MLKLVKPSREYLPAFLAGVEDYRADQNQFVGVVEWISVKSVKLVLAN